MAEVRITTRGAKRIRKGHLWVYRSDVRDALDVGAGMIGSVVDEAKNFVGQAFYSDQSEIALRFLSTSREIIDRDWWRARLRQSAERRSAIAKETNGYRLVYSEGDLLPSLIVDVYDGHYVLQALSQGTDRLQNEIVELMVEELSRDRLASGTTRVCDSLKDSSCARACFTVTRPTRSRSIKTPCDS